MLPVYWKEEFFVDTENHERCVEQYRCEKPTNNALHIYLSIHVLWLYIYSIIQMGERSNNKILYTQSIYNHSMKTIQYNSIEHTLAFLTSRQQRLSIFSHILSIHNTHPKKIYTVYFGHVHGFSQHQQQHTLHNPNNFYVIVFYIWSVFEVHSKYSTSIDFKIYWI